MGCGWLGWLARGEGCRGAAQWGWKRKNGGGNDEETQPAAGMLSCSWCGGCGWRLATVRACGRPAAVPVAALPCSASCPRHTSQSCRCGCRTMPTCYRCGCDPGTRTATSPMAAGSTPSACSSSSHARGRRAAVVAAAAWHQGSGSSGRSRSRAGRQAPALPTPGSQQPQVVPAGAPAATSPAATSPAPAAAPAATAATGQRSLPLCRCGTASRPRLTTSTCPCP